MVRTKYFLVFHVALILAGILLLVAPAATGLTGAWMTVLLSLGIALVAPSTLSLVYSWFGIDVITALEERLGIHSDVQEVGLEAVHLNASEDDGIFRRFADAHSIDLMYNTGKTTIQRYGPGIEKAIQAHQCKVRILLSSPENAYWKLEPVRAGLCPGINIVGEIEDVEATITRIIASLEGSVRRFKGGSIELRYYACVPTASIVIVDGAVARHTPYLPYAHSAEVPAYDAASARGDTLFAQYQTAFDRVWEASSSQVILKRQFL